MELMMNLPDLADQLQTADLGELKNDLRAWLEVDLGGECTAHPLGFFLFRVWTTDAVTLRLHYWPAKLRPQPVALTPIHDHVWHLRSRVLLGQLTNIVVEVEDQRSGEYDLGVITQIDRQDAVSPTDRRVAIRREIRSIHAAGDYYELVPGIFHFTEVPDNNATATIVRSEVMQSGGPRTLLPHGVGGHSPERHVLEVVDRERVARELALLFTDNRARELPPV